LGDVKSAFSSSETIRVVYSPAVAAVPIRREPRRGLCFNGAYCTVGASNNHSLSLQSEKRLSICDGVRSFFELPALGCYLLRFA
jgi:hypothetical protein